MQHVRVSLFPAEVTCVLPLLLLTPVTPVLSLTVPIHHMGDKETYCNDVWQEALSKKAWASLLSKMVQILL